MKDHVIHLPQTNESVEVFNSNWADNGGCVTEGTGRDDKTTHAFTKAASGQSCLVTKAKTSLEIASQAHTMG